MPTVQISLVGAALGAPADMLPRVATPARAAKWAAGDSGGRPRRPALVAGRSIFAAMRAGAVAGGVTARLLSSPALSVSKALLGNGTAPTRRDYGPEDAGILGSPEQLLHTVARRRLDAGRWAAYGCATGAVWGLYLVRMVPWMAVLAVMLVLWGTGMLIGGFAGAVVGAMIALHVLRRRNDGRRSAAAAARSGGAAAAAVAAYGDAAAAAGGCTSGGDRTSGTGAAGRYDGRSAGTRRADTARRRAAAARLPRARVTTPPLPEGLPPGPASAGAGA